MKMLDILLVNGRYPDYDDDSIKAGNIGIGGRTIAYIGNDTPDSGLTIDVKGKIVSPGFIDIHMHEEDFGRDGKRFIISQRMLEMGVTTVCGGNCGHSRQPLAEFKRVLNELDGAPVNYCMQSGYNTLRTRDGLGPHQQSTEAQRERYREELRKELAEGSFGISFGIEYDPAISFDEMLFAVSASEDSNHLVSAHYRNDAVLNLDPVREMIRLSREIRPRFQISHLSSCSAFRNMREALKLIADAKKTDPGLDFDTYPYHAFSCSLGSTVFDDGCFEAWQKSYGDVLLTEEPYKNVYCTEEIFRDARKNYPNMLAVAFVLDENDIELAVNSKMGMIASDGLLRGGNGHPRAAGTFPRVLGRYVREKQSITMMDALRKMTKTPADRLRLFSKGQIKEGYDADITVFDPETIIDKADFGSLERPEGIDYVFIGGDMAIEKGETINQRLGRFIAFS